jgi:putative ABC transport system permease protein
MKNSLNRLKFAFRFAYKNLIYFKLRSILIIIGFLSLCVSLFMGFSMQGFFEAFFYGELKDKYNQIDLKMEVSPYANARFFLTTALNDPSLDNILVDAIPFFEIMTLIETPSGTKTYVNTMASTMTHFRKVSNQRTYPGGELLSDEMIITKSFADKHHLKLGNTLTLYAGNTNKQFYIVEIVQDGKLFQEDTIYLSKSSSISFFLTSLNPAYSNLPPSTLVNVHNIVYLDVNPDISFDEAISALKEINAFSNLSYNLAIDSKAVNQMIYRNVSVFNMIIAMITLAVLIVMQTTFLIYFDDKKKTFANIDLLGGKKSFSYLIVLIELFILLVISFILAIFVANLIIAYGVDFLGSSITYQIQPAAILIASSVIIILFLFSSFYYFNRFNKESSIHQSKDQGKEKKESFALYSLLVVISLTLYLMSVSSLFKSILGYYSSIASIFFSILLLFTLSYSLLYLITYVLTKKRKPYVFLLHLKILLVKKAFYQYTAVILVSFLSLFLLILVNDYMDYRITAYQDEYQVDFALTNFISRYDQTFNEINNLPLVEDVDQVGLYKNITIDSINQNISFVLAIDPNRIDTYFNIDIPAETLSSLNATDYLVIILPIRYQLIYHLEVNEQITLDIDPNYPSQNFIVGGFFEKQLGNIAFTNLHKVLGYEDISFNSIFVNASSDRLILKDQLMESYSKNMVFIYDFQDDLTKLTSDMRKTTEYLTLIISIIILCFVLAIINHSSLLLGQMKDNYSRLYVLGYSHQKMRKILIIESLVIFIVILLSSLVSYVLIAVQFNRFILIFGEYENIQLTMHSLYAGVLFVFFVYTLIKIIYILQVKRIHPSEVLKLY